MRRVDVLGTEICDLTLEDAVGLALAAAASRDSARVVTPNSEIVLNAMKDPGLAAALRGAYLSLPDGAGVVAASRITGAPLRRRVAGADFAESLLEALGRRGGSVFLLGGREGVAELAAEKISKRFPGLAVVGCADGFFPESRAGELIDRINSASPDLLAVCLGSPRQELWMAENAPRLRVGVMAGLGGTIDVLAGVAARAPESWREHGLEWLYRLIREPRRYKRVLRLPLVIVKAAAVRIGGKNGKR